MATPTRTRPVPTARPRRRSDRGLPADERELKDRVGQILNRWPAVGLAMGVVRDGRLDFFHGHGVADAVARTPVTEDTVFRIGSITKTFTALAVMQLWERGLVDLDAPANDYLRAYRLVPARSGFRPATVRQLLTHTAGIGEVLRPTDLARRLFGETVGEGRPLPTLAAYYRGVLRIHAEPGSRLVYTDHGFATLGQIVEDVGHTRLDRYLREHLFDPLGMTATDLVRSERVSTHLATGYDLGSRGARPVADYEVVTVGGGAAYSSPRDMARYLAMLLGGGTTEHGSVLAPTTLAAMFAPHHQPEPRVPGMGLGFDRNSVGGHLVVGHGGIVPGFNSQILAAPDDGIGVMAFTNGARLAMLWLPTELGRVLNHLLDVGDPSVRTDLPQRPDVWADVCGWYAVPARLTDVRTRAMIGAGAEAFVRDGRLMLRGLSPIPALYRGFVLHPDDPDDPYAFRIDLSAFGLPTARVVFSSEPGGGVTAVHTDLAPLSLRRQPAGTNPRLWLTGAFGALAIAATGIALGGRRARSQRHHLA
jgi:CubicO group peptidase (beta-lactamase class C family)